MAKIIKALRSLNIRVVIIKMNDSSRFRKNRKYFEYKGRDMSDGEKVGLYLIA